MVEKILTITVPNDPVQVIEVQVPGQPGPPGPPGPAGPPDIISIGTITTTAPGTQASATISGATPNRLLNLTIPQGPQGNPGPANTLTIGTINTLTEGQAATATITGTSPNQILNLSIPRGNGVKPGGATGDILQKLTGTDYDTGWIATSSTSAINTIVRRDGNAASTFADVYVLNSPASASSATRKDYVDAGNLAATQVQTNGSQTGTAYTLTLADAHKSIHSSNAATQTITIPPNSSVAFPIGTVIRIAQMNTGKVTLAAGAGVLYYVGNTAGVGGSNAAVTTRDMYSELILRKSATDTWLVTGDFTTPTDSTVAAATTSSVVNTIVKRDANGFVGSTGFFQTGAQTTGAADLTRKDYVDALAAGKAAAVHTHSIADITDYVAPPARALTKNNVTANYTLVAADAIDIVLHSTAAAAITVTVPQDTAATIAQEIAIPWRQNGTGQITFAAGTGATIVSRGSVFKSAGQYAEGLLTKVAANTWLLSGDIVP